MTRPLRTLLVSPLPPPAGGIARWTSLITQYAARRDAVTISVINTALRWRTPHQQSPAARILAGVPQLISCAARLIREIRRKSVDVVHINSSGQIGVVRDYLLTRMANIAGVPVVYHLRFGRIPEIAARESLEWKMLAAVMRRAQTTIAIDSATCRTIAERLPQARVELVPNCIDPDSRLRNGKSLAAVPDGPFALFVGWVVPSKGVAELFDVWHDAAPAEWRLLIAGSYDEDYLRSLNLPPASRSRIEFLGEVSHEAVLDLMARCCFLVHPSHTEGFPNVVAEAMMLGRPVLGTTVGAVGDMLDGGCGTVIPPRDRRRLSDAIREMIEDESGRIEMGNRAARKANTEYTVGGVFERYMTIWCGAARLAETVR